MSLQKQEIGSNQITGLEVDPLAVLSDHFEASAFVTAPVDSVFAYADDPARLSSHMSKSSWMWAVAGCEPSSMRAAVKRSAHAFA